MISDLDGPPGSRCDAVSTEVRVKERRPLIVPYSSSSDLNGVISSNVKPSKFNFLLDTRLV